MASARYSPGLNDDGVNISNVFTSAGNDSYYTTETPAEVVTHVYSGAAGLAEFNDWYKDVHGYLAATVCVFGIIANILNIVVLTRKNMISATNCILTRSCRLGWSNNAGVFPLRATFLLHLRDRADAWTKLKWGNSIHAFLRMLQCRGPHRFNMADGGSGCLPVYLHQIPASCADDV